VTFSLTAPPQTRECVLQGQRRKSRTQSPGKPTHIQPAKASRRPKFGTLKGKIGVSDPNWWKPMTDDEVEALMAGRD